MTYVALSEEALKSITDLQAEITKLQADIKTVENEAAAQKTKLGEYFWSKHEQGETFDENAEAIINIIGDKLSGIAAMQADIEAIQKENERRSEEIKRLAEEAARKQEEAAAALAAVNAMKNITSNAESSGVVCKKCGGILFKDAKFCAECGAPVVKEEPKEEINVCAKCGAKLDEGARFCAECGTPVMARPAVASEKPIPQVRVCTKCGAKLDEGARFCAECGTPQPM